MREGGRGREGGREGGREEGREEGREGGRGKRRKDEKKKIQGTTYATATKRLMYMHTCTSVSLLLVYS